MNNQLPTVISMLEICEVCIEQLQVIFIMFCVCKTLPAVNLSAQETLHAGF
jgi:hypothetical protein